MVDVWVVQRYVRILLGGCILVIGFIVAELLIRQGHFAIVIEVLAVSLAALVGAGKLASP